MSDKCNVLITGTGNFAERIAMDIALSATKPIRVTIAAREAEERQQMEWLRNAGNARAAMAQRPVYFETAAMNWQSPETVAETLRAWDPDVVVHAATIQPSSIVIDRMTAWGYLALVGTISVTVPIQAKLADRMGKALKLCNSKAIFMNCCYPDVTNPLLVALGHPVVSGAGNIEILASAFAGELGIRKAGTLQVLAHHQNLRPWRGPASERGGIPPRVWIEGKEINDVFDRFKRVRLTAGPAIAISGCTGMPIVLAYAGERDYVGHLTGPLGLPGGYPATIRNRKPELNLPPGLTRDAAIAFNLGFEERNGMTVAGTRVQYHGRLKEELKGHGMAIADGWDVKDFDRVFDEIMALRDRLEKQPPKGV